MNKKKCVILSTSRDFDYLRRKLTEGDFNKDWEFKWIGSAGQGIRAVTPDFVLAYYPPSWDRYLTELYDNVISKMPRCEGKIFRYDDILEPISLDDVLDPVGAKHRQVAAWLLKEGLMEEGDTIHVSGITLPEKEIPIRDPNGNVIGKGKVRRDGNNLFLDGKLD